MLQTDIHTDRATTRGPIGPKKYRIKNVEHWDLDIQIRMLKIYTLTRTNQLQILEDSIQQFYFALIACFEDYLT